MAGDIGCRVIALPSAARTTAQTFPTTGTMKNDGFRGIIVYLNVTANSGTSALLLRINAVDPASGVAVPLNVAPTVVNTAAMFTYLLYPSGGTSTAVTQLSNGFALPPEFTLTIAVGDASSSTYSLGFELLS